jgi:ADP-ribosylglycohydrolase
MKNILSGISPREAGGRSMENNGNGSLMRILPLLFYIDAFVKDENKKFDLIEEVSSITHGHIIAIVCCYIYIDFNIMLLSGLNFKDAYAAIQSQKSKYKNHLSSEEYKYFERILEGDLNLLIEDEIKSDGFVIHTFEASLWCLLKSNSYKETILRAVNLGLDTDTVAAIAGGSAGIYYGFNTIPQNWIDDLIKKEEVFSISSALFKHCYNK